MRWVTPRHKIDTGQSTFTRCGRRYLGGQNNIAGTTDDAKVSCRVCLRAMSADRRRAQP